MVRLAGIDIHFNEITEKAAPSSLFCTSQLLTIKQKKSGGDLCAS